MDGITLYAIRSEIAGYLPLKVQKIQQPRPKELVFSVWNASLKDRLVLSLEGSRPFFGFSDEKKENPPIPPGFCLGLRKRLEGGRLKSIRQHRLDRVLFLDFDGHDDFGNPAPFMLVFDLAGRGQNIGLYRQGVLEAAAIPPTGGRFEHGSPYEPPSGERLDLQQSHSQEEIQEALLSARALHKGVDIGLHERLVDPTCVPVSEPASALRAVSSAIEGIGKDLALSVLLNAGVDADRPLTEESASIVAGMLAEASASLAVGTYYPTIYRGPKDRPVFHVLPLRQYEVESTFESVLEGCRALRNRENALVNEASARAYTEALHKKVLKKIESRFHAQTQDYARAQDYMKYKEWAQLLDSGGARTPSGHHEARCLDYYRDPPVEVAVPLDPKYSARDNARRYWNRYAKLSRAQKVLEESLAKTSADLERVSEMSSALEQAGTAEELARVAGILESMARKNSISFRRPRGMDYYAPAGRSVVIARPGAPKVETLEGRHGIVYFVGGNARQNDYLVTKLRKPGDIWFHVKNAKGAHVLLRPAQGGAPDDDDILMGAKLAAERSEARAAAKVEVDTVDAARIRKPRGGPPGFVTYTGQKTILVALR